MKALRLTVVLLAGCTAEALGQTDTFREELNRGCGSHEACDALVSHAQANVAKCAPNTIGVVRCRDAQADLVEANGLANAARRSDAKRQADAAKAERDAAIAKREADAKARADAAQKARCDQQIAIRDRDMQQWQERKAAVEAANKAQAESTMWINSNCSRSSIFNRGNEIAVIACPLNAPLNVVQQAQLAPDKGRLVGPYKLAEPPRALPPQPTSRVAADCEPAPAAAREPSVAKTAPTAAPAPETPGN